MLSFLLQGDKDLFASNTATSIYWLSHLALNSLLTFLSFSLSHWRPPIHLVITSHFFAGIVPPVFFLKAWIIAWVSIFFSSGMWNIQQLNYRLVPGTVCGQYSTQAGDPLTSHWLIQCLPCRLLSWTIPSTKYSIKYLWEGDTIVELEVYKIYWEETPVKVKGSQAEVSCRSLEIIMWVWHLRKERGKEEFPVGELFPAQWGACEQRLPARGVPSWARMVHF